MKGSDYALLVLTFFSGVFVGAYLYIMVFAPAYSEKPDIFNVEETDFLLRGEMYGGCESNPTGCSSFSLKANREYEYTTESDNKPVAKGKVTVEVFDELKTVITASNLEALEAVSLPCSSQNEATQFRYLLIVGGKDYSLETCVQEVGRSTLGQQLQTLWPIISTSTNEFGGIFGDGLKTFFEAELDKSFQSDEKH